MNVNEVIARCETIALRINPIVTAWFETGDSEFESAYYGLISQWEHLVRVVPAVYLEYLRGHIDQEITRYQYIADDVENSSDPMEYRRAMAKLLSLWHQKEIICQ